MGKKGWSKAVISLAALLLFSDEGVAATRFRGSLDTTFYAATIEEPSFTGSHFNGILLQSFAGALSGEQKGSPGLYVNTRLSYQSAPFPGVDPLAANLFYGYGEYSFSPMLTARLGRVMLFQTMGVTGFDGGSLSFSFFDSFLEFQIYGGLIVNDEYVIDEESYFQLSSQDYRMIVQGERLGDHVEGGELFWKIKKAGVMQFEWQAGHNATELVEHTLTFGFNSDKLFSFLEFNGFGVFNLLEKDARESYEGLRFYISKKINLQVEHRFFRPVFLPGSYWTIFTPVPGNDLRGRAQFILSRYLIIDGGYGFVAYDKKEEPLTHIVFLSIVHKYLFTLEVRFDTEFIDAPDDKRFRALLIGTKKWRYIDLTAGAGVERFRAVQYGEGLHNGYFATFGFQSPLGRRFKVSAMGEYYSNPMYQYNIKGLFKGSYRF